MTEILKCSSINKFFKTAENKTLQVLKNVTLSIPQNKLSILIGASGAGKSTLLHILGGLDKPDSGNVVIFEKSIYNLSSRELSEFRNKNIGFVFQFHHLLPEFTAEENIMIPMLIANFKKKQAKERGLELLKIVGLEARRNHKPAELSGGEAQRIAVARALACNPKLVFADEPTGNLDSKNSGIINDLFLKLKEEMNLTFLIVTHNPELMKIGDLVVEMRDGEIIRQ